MDHESWLNQLKVEERPVEFLTPHQELRWPYLLEGFVHVELKELYDKRRALHDEFLRLIKKDKDWNGSVQHLNIALTHLEIPEIEILIKALRLAYEK